MIKSACKITPEGFGGDDRDEQKFNNIGDIK